MTTTTKGSARDRLLDAADELFYAEGVHAVGIDRVIERAGVAKASLYNTFGSKDALVGEYLGRRQDAVRSRIGSRLTHGGTPRERLLAVFDAQAETIARPGYRGCAFIAASAETEPGSTVERRSDEFRGWLRQVLTDLAREGGAPDPEALGHQLHMVYDGVSIGARMDRDPEVAAVARRTVELLLDAAGL
jgi:AcrR family transcriptional regulator